MVGLVTACSRTAIFAAHDRYPAVVHIVVQNPSTRHIWRSPVTCAHKFHELISCLSSRLRQQQITSGHRIFHCEPGRPVFDSIRSVMTEDMYLSMHPDWRDDQRKAVEAVCAAEDIRVWVSEAEKVVAGFIAVKFDEMPVGWVKSTWSRSIPEYQQKGESERSSDEISLLEQMKLGGNETRHGRNRRRPGPPSCSSDLRKVWFRTTGDCSVLPQA